MIRRLGVAVAAAGAHPTYRGRRGGVCSTLANLAAYLRQNDLTRPCAQIYFASP